MKIFSELLSRSDNDLHIMIDEFDEAAKTLNSVESGKVNEITSHLLNAHRLIHEVSFTAENL